MHLIRDHLSVVERLIGVRLRHQGRVVRRGDGRTGALSFLSVSGGGFSGEGKALTLAAPSDEPDADKRLASLAEVRPPPVVVVVGLSSARLLDRAEARQGLGGIQRFATLGSATQSAAVSRGWV